MMISEETKGTIIQVLTDYYEEVVKLREANNELLNEVITLRNIFKETTEKALEMQEKLINSMPNTNETEEVIEEEKPYLDQFYTEQNTEVYTEE